MYRLSDFTPAEKEACLPVVDTMIECANTARMQGVLALEACAEKCESKFLSFMLMLVVDGTDPEYVRDIGEKLVDSEGHTGEALLSRLLMLEGVLSTQSGENPRIIEAKLLAMLGEKYLEQRGYMGGGGSGFGGITFPNLANYPLMMALDTQEALPGCMEFEKAFAPLENRDIQWLLREVDQRDLSIAMKGCSGALAKKFLANVSVRLAYMILDEMEYMGPLSEADIVSSQEKLLKILKRLQQSGDIAFSYGLGN